MNKKYNPDQFEFSFEQKHSVPDALFTPNPKSIVDTDSGLIRPPDGEIWLGDEGTGKLLPQRSPSVLPEKIFDGNINLVIEKPSVQLPGNINVVYFDLETQNLISDFNVVNFSNLKMSVGVTYNTLHEDYNTYTEKNIQSLIHELLVVDAIIGFNHQNFDYEVLSPYMPELAFDNLKKVKSLDIYLYLYNKLGFRVSLDSVIKATLKTEKTGSGVQVVEWYRQGKIDLITEYCKNDVRMTKELYEFGCEHHFILYADKHTLKNEKVYVDWKIPERFANDDSDGTN